MDIYLRDEMAEEYIPSLKFPYNFSNPYPLPPILKIDCRGCMCLDRLAITSLEKMYAQIWRKFDRPIYSAPGVIFSRSFESLIIVLQK